MDSQQAQVAIIIPADFSEQIADVREGKAVIEFYQDPTLTIGPAIMRSILNRFLDSMGGVKIAVNVFMDESNPSDYALTGRFVQRYLDTSLALSEDLEGELLELNRAFHWTGAAQVHNFDLQAFGGGSALGIISGNPQAAQGMGLLVFTVAKLFLHDLWRLGGMHRIGSLIGLAVVLIVVSSIFQLRILQKREVHA